MPKPSAVVPSIKLTASSSREEYMLALLLQYPELKGQGGLLPEYFESSENREIFDVWLGVDDVNSLKERLDPVIYDHLDVIIKRSFPGNRNNIEQRYNDCVLELKKRYLKNLAARRAESGETTADTSRLEEDIEISSQLRELDAIRSRKRNPSYNGRTRS